MSVAAPGLDRRSLTLPDWRGALARARRKVRPPRNRWCYMWAAVAVYAVVDGVLRVLSHDWPNFAYDVVEFPVASALSWMSRTRETERANSGKIIVLCLATCANGVAANLISARFL